MTAFTVYAPGSQVKSADLNALIAGGHNTLTLIIPLIGPTMGAVAPASSLVLANPNFLVVPFLLPVGKRVTAVRAQCIDSAVGPTKLQVALYDMTNGGGASAPGALSAASSGAGAQQTIAKTGLTTTILAGHTYGVYVARSTGTANCTVNGIEIDFDQLPP